MVIGKRMNLSAPYKSVEIRKNGNLFIVILASGDLNEIPRMPLD